MVKELSEAEMGLITEGLVRLREIKVQAHAEIVNVPGHERFAPADFGIPMIDALLAKIEPDEEGEQL